MNILLYFMQEKCVITEEERQLLQEEGHVLPENVALTKVGLYF